VSLKTHPMTQDIQIDSMMSESEINANRRKKLTKILNDLKWSKKGANKILSDISRTKYDSIPLDEIFSACEKFGLIPLQEDNTKWSGILCGDNEYVYIPVGWDTSEYLVNGIKTYIPITTTCLTLGWYRFNNGRYEITTVLG